MQKIDIDKVFKEKNQKLYKLLPGFVLSYIKKIAHQDEVNDFIMREGHKFNIDFATAIIENFHLKTSYNGLENIPPHGGCIIASNHPMGSLDAMTLIQAVGKVRTDMKFIVNDILLNITNLEGLFAGVNKHGKTPKEMLESIDALYASDNCVLIYPAGLVSRKQNGVIKDLEWKKSFITKAKKNKRSVIPVHVEGRNSNFFYNLANWRKRLGIKANIEMLYLVDEMYKQNEQSITINFGKALPYTFFNSTKSDQEWADFVREHVYKLHNKINM